MQANKPIWETDKHGDKTQFTYRGATVEIRRYPGVRAWGWESQYFISISGDSYPYGVPYRYYGTAVRVAKRRIEKGDFEPSQLFLKTGSFSLDYPKCEICGEKFLPENKKQTICSKHKQGAK